MIDSAIPSPDHVMGSGMGAEDCFDGITLARLSHLGQEWLMGASIPGWKPVLLDLPVRPTAQDLDAAARRGVWLAPRTSPVQRPHLAIMCCGQGSVWPGMGRALYDTFPAARDAMDCIARAADWDILSLMDETDIEKIGLTRWQQPYLFLLEYAQGAYLRSLGLRPDVLCGHSLGELVALCLAGVYTPEEAWYIFDIRSQYVNALEERADHSTGMMAVYAPEAVVTALLAAHRDVRISNYNTPTQVILSGPREVLLELRGQLRRRRIPAVVLNISLAFHHPDMRVLRPICSHLLNRLDMKPPQVPMLSNVTVGPYPDERAAICEYILDLDENAVRWVECVNRLWTEYRVRHFLELGPVDTLCGLTSDIRKEALCIPSGAKGAAAEVAAMRQAVARLYALGHLPGRGVSMLSGAVSFAAAVPGAGTAPAVVATPELSPAETATTDPQTAAVMDFLADVCQLPRKRLRPDMDLRHDLAIRSIRFPAIMLRAEELFQVSLSFDDLANVATIRDLVRVLTSGRGKDGAVSADAVHDASSPAAQAVPQTGAPALSPPEDACPRWREETEGTSLIFPLQEDPASFAVAGGTALALGGHHFSLYAEDWPERCRTATEAALPEAVLIGCLLELAAKVFPRRQVVGLEAFRMLTWPRCRRGLTLEARLGIGVPLARGDKALSACAARLELRDISPAGRRQRSWTEICRADIVLADAGSPPLVWPPETSGCRPVYGADFCVTKAALSGMIQALDVLLEAARQGVSRDTPPGKVVAAGRMAVAAEHVFAGPLRVEMFCTGGGSGTERRYGRIVDAHGKLCLTAVDLVVQPSLPAV